MLTLPLAAKAASNCRPCTVTGARRVTQARGHTRVPAQRETAYASTTAAQPTETVAKSASSLNITRTKLDSVFAYPLTAAIAEPDQQSLDTTTIRLQSIYDSLEDIFYCKGGYAIPARERTLIDATGGSASYGELLAEGAPAVWRSFGLDSTSVLYDLGSGVGRFVLQTAANKRIKKAVGIELSITRHEMAVAALERLQHQCELQTPVELRNEDLTKSEINDGTHFYLCSTAFGAAACRGIAQRLSESPNFQVLITSRALPLQSYLYKVGDFECPYSWIATGQGHVYVKSLSDAPAGVLAHFFCRDGICCLPSHPYSLPVAPDVADALSSHIKLRPITEWCSQSNGQ